MMPKKRPARSSSVPDRVPIAFRSTTASVAQRTTPVVKGLPRGVPSKLHQSPYLSSARSDQGTRVTPSSVSSRASSRAYPSAIQELSREYSTVLRPRKALRAPYERRDSLPTSRPATVRREVPARLSKPAATGRWVWVEGTGAGQQSGTEPAPSEPAAPRGGTVGATRSVLTARGTLERVRVPAAELAERPGRRVPSQIASATYRSVSQDVDSARRAAHTRSFTPVDLRSDERWRKVTTEYVPPPEVPRSRPKEGHTGNTPQPTTGPASVSPAAARARIDVQRSPSESSRIDARSTVSIQQSLDEERRAEERKVIARLLEVNERGKSSESRIRAERDVLLGLLLEKHGLDPQGQVAYVSSDESAAPRGVPGLALRTPSQTPDGASSSADSLRAGAARHAFAGAFALQPPSYAPEAHAGMIRMPYGAYGAPVPPGVAAPSAGAAVPQGMPVGPGQMGLAGAGQMGLAGAPQNGPPGHGMHPAGYVPGAMGWGMPMQPPANYWYGNGMMPGYHSPAHGPAHASPTPARPQDPTSAPGRTVGAAGSVSGSDRLGGTVPLGDAAITEAEAALHGLAEGGRKWSPQLGSSSLGPLVESVRVETPPGSGTLSHAMVLPGSTGSIGAEVPKMEMPPATHPVLDDSSCPVTERQMEPESRNRQQGSEPPVARAASAAPAKPATPPPNAVPHAHSPKPATPEPELDAAALAAVLEANRENEERVAARKARLEKLSHGQLAKLVFKRYDVDGDRLLGPWEYNLLLSHIEHDVTQADTFVTPVNKLRLEMSLDNARANVLRTLFLAPAISSLQCLGGLTAPGQHKYNGKRARIRAVNKDGTIDVSVPGGVQLTVQQHNVVWDCALEI
eukprot:TRINITY_DN16623_c0_g1_i1.p1 TRINITY_DN16623_c0_g1~~TRINITY_DN16623_c0_g1_i1.p1  ORF type:complete len:856 (+),score=108.90 TRINITY_DN16623_c0_g1_i1:70-2637(+)